MVQEFVDHSRVRVVGVLHDEESLWGAEGSESEGVSTQEDLVGDFVGECCDGWLGMVPGLKGEGGEGGGKKEREGGKLLRWDSPPDVGGKERVGKEDKVVGREKGFDGGDAYGEEVECRFFPAASGAFGWKADAVGVETC